ncbi:MAG: hypothetical protein GY714_32440 [Desulfobacterales bacterium]|nr:hypothetical protein [Desulfobacterales bacterium]
MKTEHHEPYFPSFPTIEEFVSTEDIKLPNWNPESHFDGYLSSLVREESPAFGYDERDDEIMITDEMRSQYQRYRLYVCRLKMLAYSFVSWRAMCIGYICCHDSCFSLLKCRAILKTLTSRNIGCSLLMIQAFDFAVDIIFWMLSTKFCGSNVEKMNSICKELIPPKNLHKNQDKNELMIDYRYRIQELKYHWQITGQHGYKLSESFFMYGDGSKESSFSLVMILLSLKELFAPSWETLRCVEESKVLIASQIPTTSVKWSSKLQMDLSIIKKLTETSFSSNLYKSSFSIIPRHEFSKIPNKESDDVSQRSNKHNMSLEEAIEKCKDKQYSDLAPDLDRFFARGRRVGRSHEILQSIRHRVGCYESDDLAQLITTFKRNCENCETLKVRNSLAGQIVLKAGSIHRKWTEKVRLFLENEENIMGAYGEDQIYRHSPTTDEELS